MLVLAKVGAPSWGPAVLTAIILGAAALAAWLLLRKRSARLAAGALVVGAVLVVGCFVPPPAWVVHHELRGRFGGHVEMDVQAEPGARATATDGGSAILAGGRLALDCPARCDFTVAGARVDAPRATLDGGPLILRDAEVYCRQPGLTLRWLAAPSCFDCSVTEYVVGEGARGTVAPAPASAFSC